MLQTHRFIFAGSVVLPDLSCHPRSRKFDLKLQGAGNIKWKEVQMSRWFGLGGLIVLGVCLAWGGRATGKPSPAEMRSPVEKAAAAQKAPPRENLELQIAALSTIHELELTPAQLRAFKEIASGIAQKADPPGGEMPPGYRAALTALRDALVKDNEDKIDEAQEKVQDLRDKDDIDTETHIQIADEAKKQADPALKLLTVRQIANYLAAHGDEIPDPMETLTDAIREVRGKSDAEFKAIRKEAVEQVSLLATGLNGRGTKAIEHRVTELLTKVREASDKDFEAGKANWEEEANKIAADCDGISGLRHWLEREMVELLSNPELPAVLAMRVK